MITIEGLTRLFYEIERERLTLVVHPDDEDAINQILNRADGLVLPLVLTNEWAVGPGQVIVFKGTKTDLYLGVL